MVPFVHNVVTLHTKEMQSSPGMIKRVLYTSGGVLGAAFLTFTLGALGHWIDNILGVFWAMAISITLGAILFFIADIIWKRIRKVDKLKQEFLTVAAHRLRTPLTRMRWNVAGLEEEVATEKGRESLNLIKGTVDDLVGVVNKFLDAAESEKASLYYDYIFELVNFGNIVRLAIADYKTGMVKKRLELIVHINDRAPHIFVDVERMRVAVGALIENAVVYTPSGGRIEIEVNSDGKTVFCTVRDTGLGIQKEELPRIFSKFYRSKEATSTDPDRIGLGLFLARQIIERHRGTIVVSSLGRFKGAEFSVALPVLNIKRLA